MHLYYAKMIADEIFGQLQPFCDKIDIAGSIRRKREDVKDIEIVAIPKRTIQESQDLFGDTRTKQVILHPGYVKIIQNLGTVVKGKPAGRYMQIETIRSISGREYTINVDLFMPQAHDYYRQLAIRTGSADYSHRYIAVAWAKKGWCGTDSGLRKISECFKLSDNKWIIRPEVKDNPTLPPVWQDEEHFFRWLGVQYLEPQHRNL